MTVAEQLRAARARLAPASDSARLDAELLVAHGLGQSRAALLARERDELSATDAMRIEALLARRAAGEPVAYLLGTQGFWSLDLRVTADTLIPRPETETLVEWALHLLQGSTAIPAQARIQSSSRDHGPSCASREKSSRLCANDEAAGNAPRILDLGTGSGCIALALARERPDAKVIATDRSPGALAVARDNAQRNAIPNVAFREGAWFEALHADDGPFDLIVSNPPYIAESDPHLAALAHEPRSALVAGDDGLDDLRLIVRAAPTRLRARGGLLVEHGYDQGAAVRALFQGAGFAHIETRRDLEGRERVTGGMRA